VSFLVYQQRVVERTTTCCDGYTRSGSGEECIREKMSVEFAN